MRLMANSMASFPFPKVAMISSTGMMVCQGLG